MKLIILAIVLLFISLVSAASESVTAALVQPTPIQSISQAQALIVLTYCGEVRFLTGVDGTGSNFFFTLSKMTKPQIKIFLDVAAWHDLNNVPVTQFDITKELHIPCIQA